MLMLFGADPFALVELARDLDDAARSITAARRVVAEARPRGGGGGELPAGVRAWATAEADHHDSHVC